MKELQDIAQNLQTATELYPSFSPSCKCNRILSSISEKYPEQPDHCSTVADQARSWVSVAPGSGMAVGREGLCQGIQGRSSHALSLWVCVLSWFSKCGARQALFRQCTKLGLVLFPACRAAPRESAAVLLFAVRGTALVISQLPYFNCLACGMRLDFFKPKIITLGCCQIIRGAGRQLEVDRLSTRGRGAGVTRMLGEEV